MKRFFKFVKEITPWLLAGLTLMLGSWAADAWESNLREWYTGFQGLFNWKWVVTVLFIGSILTLRFFKNRFFPPRTKELKKRGIEQRKHLIQFLSDIHGVEEKQSAIPGWFNPTWSLESDLESLEAIKTNEPWKRWSWEMSLRGIHQHLYTVETVTLVCSQSSIRLVPYFVALCRKYYDFKDIRFFVYALKQNRAVLLNASDITGKEEVCGFDFEEFDNLYEALHSLLKVLKRRKIREQDIMIDITGGQKPNSVVGAALTFQTKLMFQYVRTNEPHSIVTYDVVQAASDAQGFRV